MKIQVLSVSIALAFSLCITSCQLADLVPDTTGRQIESLSRQAMQQLPESENACDSFDYFPDGGMQSFYCHIKQVITYERAREILPVSIFLHGPHGTELDLNNSRSFGHYNPEFVALLTEYGVPAARDESFRRATQGIYDEYVSPLARIMFVTYRKFQKNPELLRNEVRKLENQLEKGQDVHPLYYEKYFYFMNPGFADNPEGGFEYFSDRGFDGGYSGNVVKTAAYFWIRRSIDGTDKEFFRALMKLMQTYDSAYLQL